MLVFREGWYKILARVSALEAQASALQERVDRHGRIMFQLLEHLNLEVQDVKPDFRGVRVVDKPHA